MGRSRSQSRRDLAKGTYGEGGEGGLGGLEEGGVTLKTLNWG